MTTNGHPAQQEEILEAIEESLISVNLPGRQHIWVSSQQDHDLPLTSTHRHKPPQARQNLKDRHRFG